jgi:polyphosphate kinase
VPKEKLEKAKPLEVRRLLNRELSWLQFNRRVLAEALDERTPLLERVRFLSIFNSNLDEFFMIRVSGLRTQMASAATERSTDGLTASEQLAAIRSDLLPTPRSEHGALARPEREPEQGGRARCCPTRS